MKYVKEFLANTALGAVILGTYVSLASEPNLDSLVGAGLAGYGVWFLSVLARAVGKRMFKKSDSPSENVHYIK